MKHFQNDTTAAIATGISGSSAVITFAQIYQPLVTFGVGLLGIISGILAIIYWAKKIDKIEFSVQDDGIGISENELLDVFGTSVVSSKTKTSAGGRGFGLALCKKVIEVHKGEIWARSDEIKGVTFYFTIPLFSE